MVLTDEIDQKVMKLFSLGMSYEDISANISEIYDVGVDKSQISGITDRIIPVTKEWQGRSLEASISDSIFGWNISYKDKKKFVEDLKLVYKADTKELAEINLLELEEKWGKKYSIVIKSWNENCEHLSQDLRIDRNIKI